MTAKSPPPRSQRSVAPAHGAATPAARSRKPAHRQVLTPTSWIDAATEVLVDKGVSHVRVDLLATQLGVTRGSFYWHFRDRDDLLHRMLQAWSERTTEQLTERLDRAQTDPREQIRDLISLPFRGRSALRAAGIELAIRTWARRDEAARRAVDRSDAYRLAYHESLFVALGFENDEAKSRAFLLYGYEVAESQMHGQGTAAQRRARAAFVERLIQQPLAS